MGPGVVNLNRVICNQLNGNYRVDFGRITSKLFDCIAHGGKVDNRRNSREVLH